MRILLALLLLSVSTQAATLATTRAKVDTWLTNNFPLVISKQNTYLANNGRYWQGIFSASSTNIIPNFTTAADGDTVQDNLNAIPYYQIESAEVIFPTLVGVALPATFQVDQYIGPLGKGYVFTVWVRFNGTIYTRSHNTGPEAWREADWSAWTPGP